MNLQSRNQLILGDCLEKMKDIPSNSIDAVITDPPFAMAGGISNGYTSKSDSQFFEYWFSDVCKELIRVIKPTGCMFIWCDWRTIGIIDKCLQKSSDAYDGWYISQELIHDRKMIGMGKPFRNQTDKIAFIRGRKTDYKERIPNTQPNIISEYWYYGKHDFHPSQKDVEMAKKLVIWASDENDIILDPFGGSGTTVIACINTKRDYICIEKDDNYFSIMEERVKNHQIQTMLL